MRSATLKREAPEGPFLVERARLEDTVERSFARGMLAGIFGGLVGTIVMTQFQNAWSGVSNALKNSDSEEKGVQQRERQQPQQDEKEDTTMKAAGKIAEAAGHQLSHEQKKALGPVVHYSFGTLQGGLYGAVTELIGRPGGLFDGLIFGAALFVIADEIAVPALGFSPKPSESLLSSHLYALASHLVYGVTTEITRNGLRSRL